MASLLAELKRRNVIRVAIGYFVLAWVVLQITDLVAPALLLPEWTLSFVTFIGIIGFPFAMFFAWVFELTPEGLQRSEDVEPDQSITGNTGSNLNKMIIGLLLLAVLILLADRLFGLSGQFSMPGSEPAVQAVPADVAGAVSAETPESAGPRSIAVLPFVNMSDDKEQEYFSDGISEELLNALAQIRELRVAARTSSFAFKGKNQDITDIGDQLNVETVLEGSVRKSGAKVRITAQLINVEDGYHLWSDTYDRDLTDIFAVQDEISAAIVLALKVHLTDEPPPRAEQPVAIAAYNFYLQARHNVRLRSKDTLELALQQFQQALDVQPQYAAAWAGKALATSLLRDDQYGDIPGEEASRLSQGYLDIAFSIDPDIGVGHAAQALVYMDTNDCKRAIVSTERALQRLPNEGILYVWKGMCLERTGEYSAAEEALDQAFAIDPLHRSVRINWLQQKVAQGGAAEVRAMTTPGTVEYYELEWLIARQEGRWADMYLIASEAYAEYARTYSQRQQALAQFFWLGEPAQALHSLPPAFVMYFDALKSPQKLIDELGGRAPESLSPRQREGLLLALSTQQQWQGILATVDHLQLETATEFGDVSAGESAFSNALAQAVAFYFLGETERATALAVKLKRCIEQAKAKGLAFEEYGAPLGEIEFLLGNKAEAIAVMRQLFVKHRLSPLFATRLELYKSATEDNSKLEALVAEVQAKLNLERQKLGWEPKALEEI
ncbi:hypothetical protein EY643_17230 [Halioglobus maricola]|uniref:Uncharacterized protein n=1 Tax=Halioglobus maricola TaxID=2601894 RepID=A0A5P9NN70_9GAMM|nr:FlgO family outer membrane protein [Halioglobus maricola]QFU77261.1 hypothetical protein EY643_17230 [Halioglobus maricola]